MSQQKEHEEVFDPISVRFHGGIINTLTKELPNDAVAFRELIKNAYDASADSVEIKLDTKSRILTIEDDGDGMDISGMRNLFHLGQSRKQYGSVFESSRSKETRFVQGSKGIGFLSAMHFGSNVTWFSAKEGQYVHSISCDREALKALDDLSKAEIIPQQSSIKKRGTKVVIELDEYHYSNVCKYINNYEWRSKLANTFRQSKLKISFIVDNEALDFELFDGFKKRNEKHHYFYVRFCSEKNRVEIYNESHLVDNFPFSEDWPESSLSISGEIIILKLSNSIRVKQISNLFVNKDKSLTPLLYINDNLFEDYSLFNPDILRKQKSGQSLPQMIGYIDITCDSPDLDYNPDRTKFVENSLTDFIQSTLEKLNINIQKRASSYKNKPESHLKIGFPIPQSNFSPACIMVVEKKEYKIPSPQIDLRTLILSATNSEGASIDITKIEILVNGESIASNILESQLSSGCIDVDFLYNDANTKRIANHSKLIFKAEKQPKIQKQLLEFALKDPCTTYMKVCARLNSELNKIFAAQKESCNEVYACSLRSVFELSAASIRSTTLLPKDVREKAKIEDLIGHIAALFTTDNKLKEQITKNSDIDFHTLGNLTKEEFVKAYKLSNRGAHKSSAYLTGSQISDIAKEASIFSYLVNVILNVKNQTSDEETK